MRPWCRLFLAAALAAAGSFARAQVETAWTDPAWAAVLAPTLRLDWDQEGVWRELRGLDLDSERGLAALVPLSKYLESQKYTPDTFSALPDWERKEVLRGAIETIAGRARTAVRRTSRNAIRSAPSTEQREAMLRRLRAMRETLLPFLDEGDIDKLTAAQLSLTIGATPPSPAAPRAPRVAGAPELQPRQLELLRSVFGRALGSRPAFDYALRLADPAEAWAAIDDLRKDPTRLSSTLYAIFTGLRAVIQSDLPEAERDRLARALAGRYTAFLDQVRTAPELQPELRAGAGRAGSRFMKGGQLLDELTKLRELQDILTFIGIELSAEKPADAQEGGGALWEPPARAVIPVAPKTPDEDAVTTFQNSLAPVLEKARWVRSELSRRREAARLVGVRGGLVDHPQAGAGWQAFVADAMGWLKAAQAVASRFHWFSLKAGVTGSRPKPIIWVPNTPGLRLVPTKDGYILNAAFQTNIESAEAVQAVQRSIERYWKGEFKEKGQRRKLVTRVEVSRVDARHPWIPGGLWLLDGFQGLTNAVPNKLTLARRFRFDEPAHEFGHLLGLGDDYSESFDFKSRVATHTLRHASIMGSNSGAVLPRHLQLAVSLLRQKCLAGPASLKH
jgi:hypothetical protein